MNKKQEWWAGVCVCGRGIKVSTKPSPYYVFTLDGKTGTFPLICSNCNNKLEVEDFKKIK